MSLETLFILPFMIHAMMKSAKIWTDEQDQILVFKGILVFKRPLKTREI